MTHAEEDRAIEAGLCEGLTWAEAYDVLSELTAPRWVIWWRFELAADRRWQEATARAV